MGATLAPPVWCRFCMGPCLWFVRVFVLRCLCCCVSVFICVCCFVRVVCFRVFLFSRVVVFAIVAFVCFSFVLIAVVVLHHYYSARAEMNINDQR